MKKVNYNDILNEISPLNKSLFKEFQRQGRLEDSIKFLEGFLEEDEELDL